MSEHNFVVAERGSKWHLAYSMVLTEAMIAASNFVREVLTGGGRGGMSCMEAGEWGEIAPTFRFTQKRGGVEREMVCSVFECWPMLRIPDAPPRPNYETWLPKHYPDYQRLLSSARFVMGATPADQRAFRDVHDKVMKEWRKVNDEYSRRSYMSVPRGTPVTDVLDSVPEWEIELVTIKEAQKHANRKSAKPSLSDGASLHNYHADMAEWRDFIDESFGWGAPRPGAMVYPLERDPEVVKASAPAKPRKRTVKPKAKVAA